MYSDGATFDKPVLTTSAALEIILIEGTSQAGFPSPAEDLGAQRIDLAKVLIKHSQATYCWRASGHSMIVAGIFDNDIMVIDRAIRPRHNHIVVAIVEGELDLGEGDSDDALAVKSSLISAVDTINQRFGKGTMKMASAGLEGDRRVWSMKQERRTPAYTTNWDDIPVARA